MPWGDATVSCRESPPPALAGERPDMSPMLFARAISKDEPIKVFNNGDMIRDFTYIDGIAEFMKWYTAPLRVQSIRHCLTARFLPSFTMRSSLRTRFSNAMTLAWKGAFDSFESGKRIRSFSQVRLQFYRA